MPQDPYDLQYSCIANSHRGAGCTNFARNYTSAWEIRHNRYGASVVLEFASVRDLRPLEVEQIPRHTKSKNALAGRERVTADGRRRNQ